MTDYLSVRIRSPDPPHRDNSHQQALSRPTIQEPDDLAPVTTRQPGPDRCHRGMGSSLDTRISLALFHISALAMEPGVSVY